jgi:DNA-binding CsgD family transcriptional regulator
MLASARQRAFTSHPARFAGQTLARRAVAPADARSYDRVMEQSLPERDESLLDRLTPREAQVLRFTSQGRTNSQVAGDLGVSVHSVKFHLASVYRKLGVRNRTEAAALYLNLNLNEAGLRVP